MKKQIQAITKKHEGKLIAIASTEDKDRSGDVLPVNKWDFQNFLKNPVLQAGHDYRPQYTVGVAKNIKVVDRTVTFEPVFHTITPLAKQIKQMYEEGILRAWSVGFIPARDANGMNELLEVSAVAVPANQNALTMMKSLDDVEQKAIANEVEVWVKNLAEAGEEEMENNDEVEAEVKVLAGDPCTMPDGTPGSYAPNEVGELVCVVSGLSAKAEGDTCTMEDGSDGMMGFDEDGMLTCMPMKSAKGIETQQTGETNGHTHLAYYDETSGTGTTSVVEDHAHPISEFVVSEVNGHTHELVIDGVDTEEAGYGMGGKKKPKKKELTGVELWNKSFPNVFKKAFDVAEGYTLNISTDNKIYTDFLGCEVKELFVNTYTIPAPLTGTYLSAFKHLLTEQYGLKDTRNFVGGNEYPPQYEVIQLNATKSDDFLVEGVQFFTKSESDAGIVYRVYPTWFGLNVALITTLSQKEINVNLLEQAHAWVQENNYLKGQKFALSGEFLSNTDDSMDDVFVKDSVKESINRSLTAIQKENASSRGLLFIGPPGTGKTKTGRVMMNGTDTTFIWVSSKDFAMIGAARGIKLSFELARSLAPSIVFMEDIDTWVKYETDILKTELDGLLQNKGVLTVLTSNSPEQFPDALIDRPGRFHDIIDFELPDSELRKSMLVKWVGDIDEKTLGDILDRSEGFSGAYMKELVEYARLIQEDEDITMSEALLKSLDKIEKMKELVGRIRQTTKSFDIVEKEGRVLSKKNKQIIEQAKDALEEVLKISDRKLDEEIPMVEEGQKSVKLMSDLDAEGKRFSRKAENNINADELALKALQRIVGMGNLALAQKRKEKKQSK